MHEESKSVSLMWQQPVIESITSNREPQPDFEAMYLLMPTTHNVNRIIQDFTNHKQYAAAHLFFLEGQSCAVMCHNHADARCRVT